ncbi:hypothetical protein RI367_005337 [Sorochytrium milnesiophthora]
MNFSSKSTSSTKPKGLAGGQASTSSKTSFLAALDKLKASASSATSSTTGTKSAPPAAPLNLRTGLNVSAARANRQSVFGDDDEDDNGDADGGRGRVARRAGITKARMATAPPLQYSAGNQRLVEKAKQEALEQDATVFEYDAVYDGIKGRAAANKQKIASASGDTAADDDNKPKYMENLMRTAALRKIDRLRADERKYKRERETEAGIYDDKEQFVTGGYRAALEEARKMEQEENAREAQDALKRKDGLAAFYRNMLNRSAAEHESLDKVDVTVVDKSNTDSVGAGDGEAKADRSKALSAQGVLVNDSNEVVDKRQLLSAGLNVSARKRPVSASTDAGGQQHDSSSLGTSGQHRQQLDPDTSRRRGRDQQMQMVSQKQVIEAERDAEEQALKAKLQKKTDETSISDARARYLARRATKQQAAAPSSVS